MPEIFDFLTEFLDFNLMLVSELTWQITNGDVFNVDNMSDKELREAIIDDILGVTMWEKQSEKTAVFTTKTLCRFLTSKQKKRIKETMKHVEVRGLLNKNLKDNLRIIDNQETLQAAMTYCGVWYTGYNMPKDLITMDRQVLQRAIDENGGVENLATGIMMEVEATHKGNKTFN